MIFSQASLEELKTILDSQSIQFSERDKLSDAAISIARFVLAKELTIAKNESRQDG